jgi:hypothetical protein
MVFPEEAVALTESVALVFVHVMLPDALQLTVGVLTLDCSVVLDVAVQPLPDCVTVTV